MAVKTLKDKQVLYKQVFGNPAGRKVLTELNAFCYMMNTTAGRTESIERLEGRREVFLDIMKTLKMNFDEVFEEYIDDDF